MKNNISIRFASKDDARELSLIYKPYVEKTAISFEYIAPDEKEFEKRIKEKTIKYPYLLAECGEEIVGFCYASQFLPRPAYEHSVETTLYVKEGYRGFGIGRKLYLALEKLLKLQNVLSLNACIACADKPDETLDNSSMLFHSKMGYRYVGRFNSSGYKFGRFYDMIWMEKIISDTSEPFDEFIPFFHISSDAQRVLDEFITKL